MTTHGYETDVIAWANEQANLIRTHQFHLLDLEHLAEEIEDVGKSEQRELASRLVVLLCHLIKWKFQPERQSRSWQITIQNQRKAIRIHLKKTPSLRTKFQDLEWWDVIWGDAVSEAAKETGLDTFPEYCPWLQEQVLSDEWLQP